MSQKYIYLDNAATTKVDEQVLAVMEPYFSQKYGNPSSIHERGQEARGALDLAREQVAGFLGCPPREVIFTSCATESNNLAIKGLAEAMHRCTVCGIECPDKGRVPHIIVSPIEHHCVMDVGKHLEKMGYEVSFLPVDQYGQVSLSDVRSSIKENTVLVSVMYVNNEIGTIQPIEEIGKLLAEVNRDRLTKNLKKIYFHTDAVQAIQYLDCNVNKLGVDLLSLTAHKFYGPKGTGALYIRKGTPLTRQIDGGGQEYYLRAGTENVAGIVGLGAAIEMAAKFKTQNSGLKVIKDLRDKLIKGVLENIDGAKLTGHPEMRAPHIASFVISGVEGESVLLMLDQAGVAASSGSACTSGLLEASHVLLATGVKAEEAHGSLRFSLSKDSTQDDVDYVIYVLPEIVEKLRKIAP